MLERIEVRGAGLKGRCFDIALQAPVLYCGPNGSGKTSSLNAFVGLLRDWRQIPGINKDGLTVLEGFGDGLRIRRTYGQKRSLDVVHGLEKSDILDGGQKLIDAALGKTTTLVWRLGGLLDASADKQKSLLLSVAGVDQEFFSEALLAQLQQDVLRGTPEGEESRRYLLDKVGVICGGPNRTVDIVQWTSHAREFFGAARRETDALLKRARKIREGLPVLAEDNLPPGTLGVRKTALADIEVEIRQAREQRVAILAASGCEPMDHEEYDRIRREHGLLQTSTSATPPSIEGSVADEDLVERQIAKAAQTVSQAEIRLAKKQAEHHRILGDCEGIAKLGTCPTCGSTGEHLTVAVTALREKADDVQFDVEVLADDVASCTKALMGHQAVAKAIRDRQKWDEDQAKMRRLADRLNRAGNVPDTASLDAQIAQMANNKSGLDADIAALTQRLGVAETDRKNRLAIAVLERQLAGCKALEATVRTIERGTLGASAGKICGLANEVFKAICGAEARVWIDLEHWMIGAVINTQLPVAVPDLSRGERAALVASLGWAMAAQQPYRALVLDDLGELDTDRMVRLTRWAAGRMSDGTLHAFQAAVRCSPDRFKYLHDSIGEARAVWLGPQEAVNG